MFVVWDGTEYRCASVDACKWTDEVVPYAPYVTEEPWIDRYGCQYVVHGDDISTDADGRDCYEGVKKAGRFLVCKRTEGISTTGTLPRQSLLIPEISWEECFFVLEII